MAITDNTAKWEVKKVGAGTPAEMVGATASAKGKSGIVPEPGAGANGKFLRGDGTWQDVPTPSLSGLGLTATATELNYVDGVTSSIQTQLNNMIKALSASGTTVTYTKGDGSTGTITTQDTKYSLPTASSSTLGGIKVGSGLSISSGVLSASGGTITASSLGTNGYVKFSNGLILQWGYLSKSSNKTLTFPIAFTQSVYSVLRTAVNDSSGYIRGNETGIVSFSLTSVSVGESQYWASYLFAIGKQQCGYTTSINGGDALSFPIAFSTTNYVITGSTYDDLLIYCPKFTDKTTTTCVMYNGIGHVSYNGTSRLDWIALGK